MGGRLGGINNLGMKRNVGQIGFPLLQERSDDHQLYKFGH